MRYFFHIRNGIDLDVDYMDKAGVRFRTPADAVSHGELIAGELAGDSDPFNGYAVHVEDADGRLVATIPVRRS